MAAGVGRQSSAVINNHSFNCRVEGISFLLPTSPRRVDTQGASDRMHSLSSHWLEMPCGAGGLRSGVLGLVRRGRTELLPPPASLAGSRHPCSVLNGSLQHMILQMISSSTCVTRICMVVCKEDTGVSRAQHSGSAGDDPQGNSPFLEGLSGRVRVAHDIRAAFLFCICAPEPGDSAPQQKLVTLPLGVTGLERTDGMVHVLGTGRQLSPPGPEGSLLHGNLHPLVVLYLPECCQELTQELGFCPYFSVWVCIHVMCKLTPEFEWCYFARLLSPQPRDTNSS